MISHFVGLSTKPISFAAFVINSTSEATVSSWPESVKSSINTNSTSDLHLERIGWTASLKFQCTYWIALLETFFRQDLVFSKGKNRFTGASCMDEAVKFWSVLVCCIQNDIPRTELKALMKSSFTITWSGGISDRRRLVACTAAFASPGTATPNGLVWGFRLFSGWRDGLHTFQPVFS